LLVGVGWGLSGRRVVFRLRDSRPLPTMETGEEVVVMMRKPVALVGDEAWRRRRVRPLAGGVSIGVVGRGAGTLGLVTGRVFYTASHVVYEERPEVIVYQPAPADTGDALEVGVVEEARLPRPLTLTEKLRLRVCFECVEGEDAAVEIALVRLFEGIDAAEGEVYLGPERRARVREPLALVFAGSPSDGVYFAAPLPGRRVRVGERLWKCARSGCAEARVIANDVKVVVDYGRGLGDVMISGAVALRGPVRPGDSGAVLFRGFA